MREDGSMMSPGAYANPCSKCGGRGSLPHYERWSGGICYGCGGTGEEPKGGHRTPRRPPARGKLPHPSPAESKTLADRYLAETKKLLDLGERESPDQYDAYADNPSDLDAQSRAEEAMWQRAFAAYFAAGVAVGKSVVDLSRFNRAVERARRFIAFTEGIRQFDAGVKAGVIEQASRYEGIEWEGR